MEYILYGCLQGIICALMINLLAKLGLFPMVAIFLPKDNNDNRPN